MKSAGKARSNGLYRHIRTSKEIIRNLLNDSYKYVIIVPNYMNCKYNKHEFATEKEYYEEISRSSFYNRGRG